LNREIEGYASATSINKGEAISLYVKTVNPTYTISVYRVGWYGGSGGRLVHTSPKLNRFAQPACEHDVNTHRVECNWQNPYVITANNPAISSDWPSGVYLAKLVGSSGKQSYIIFVVRDDNRASDILFQTSVTTYAAYNPWTDIPNPSYLSATDPLYLKFMNYSSYTTPQADKVSFNRPYQFVNPSTGRQLKGAGFFLEWESSMVRFLEREGYDVSYNTNIDTHAMPGSLLNHKAFLSVGHDEYWSKEIRDNVEAARNAGVNLAFFGANAAYWQIRLEPSNSSNGNKPNRNIAAYRFNFTNDPVYLANPASQLVTRLWRDLPIPRPEAALVGMQFIYNTLDLDMVISDCSSALSNGTKSPANATVRLQSGDKLTGMLGYEVDAVVPSSPKNVQVLSKTPFVCTNTSFPFCDGVTPQYANSTYYIAPNGAKVFAAGSMYWNWGLDDGGPLAGARVNENVKTITRNVLNALISPP
jgi:protein-S-isoprenylcysteine O-methyltransferase Ste14